MNGKHAVTISLAVGAAAVAGTIAATKSIDLGRPAAPATASPALIAKRTKALDRTEAALRKALEQRPPKLPPVPARISAPTPSTAAPVAATPIAAPTQQAPAQIAAPAQAPARIAVPTQRPAQRVVYVRPAPRVVTAPRSGEHEAEHEEEHESEHEGAHESEGGSYQAAQGGSHEEEGGFDD